MDYICNLPIAKALETLATTTHIRDFSRKKNARGAYCNFLHFRGASHVPICSHTGGQSNFQRGSAPLSHSKKNLHTWNITKTELENDYSKHHGDSVK